MDIIESYCTNNSRYKAAQIFYPKGVVLHSIGCPQPKAKVLWNSWKNNSSPYLTHYVLDDKEIYHCMPNNYKCWHVCSPGNDQFLGIEMCEPSQIKYTSGATFTISNLDAARKYALACYDNAIWLIAKLCKDYGWDPMTQVWTHYEITMRKMSNTDHVDPVHLHKGLGLDIDLTKLRKDVKAAMSGIYVNTVPSTSTSSSSSNTTSTVMYRIRKSWADANSQIGAYSSLENAKKAWKEGYYVYDANGKVVYPVSSSASSNTSTNMYRIRKTWADAASQIGAYSSLENAKKAWKSGYYVFDDNGKVVYPNAAPADTSYMVTVTADVLNIRKGPSTGYAVVGSIKKGGAYTIVETNGNWGKLKSGAGWICLDYTEKV